MYRYIFILIISMLMVCGPAGVFAQADTTSKDTAAVMVKKVDSAGRQLCIGVDIFRPLMSTFQTDRYGYELSIDYYARNDFYLVAEAGYGGSKVNYTDLKYNTSNQFMRIGFNKSALSRSNRRDWDMMFIGFRLAAADVNRSSASYVVTDSLWGTSSGTVAKKPAFVAAWAEVTGGVRVELFKGISAGWNIRGKFMLNGKSFKDLAPLYIAGYGRGDKNAIFDFNMYISYAVRWNRKHGTGTGTTDKGPAASKP